MKYWYRGVFNWPEAGNHRSELKLEQVEILVASTFLKQYPFR